MKTLHRIVLFALVSLALAGCEKKVLFSEQKVPTDGGAVFEFSMAEDGKPLEIYLETDIFFTEASQYRLLSYLTTPSDETLPGEMVTSAEEEAKPSSPSGGVVRRYRQKTADSHLLYRLRSQTGRYHLDLQQDPSVRGGMIQKIRLVVKG